MALPGFHGSSRPCSITLPAGRCQPRLIHLLAMKVAAARAVGDSEDIRIPAPTVGAVLPSCSLWMSSTRHPRYRQRCDGALYARKNPHSVRWEVIHGELARDDPNHVRVIVSEVPEGCVRPRPREERVTDDLVASTVLSAYSRFSD